jgi:hypothetical protein
MSPAVFEPTISAGKRPQTYALDRAATGTSDLYPLPKNIRFIILTILKLAGIVTRKMADETHAKIWLGDMIERVHLEDLVVYGE